jgi:formylglycine-generating enzyme required for sulfatase activity
MGPLAWMTLGLLLAAPARMTRVGPGDLHPVYLPDKDTTTVPVDGFLLDRTPVTNGDFLDFVRRNPEWRKGQVKPLFAEGGYLARWQGPLMLGPSAPEDAPVTQVSWFAARAYCEARGARLPTTNEWELAAQEGTRDPKVLAQILAWYGQPTPKVLPPVAQRAPSRDGIYDLHGLVWEWVEDFNDTLVSSDSREGQSADRVRFCGAGAVGSSDRTDYAAFMRVAFRSSLEGRFTISNLGFRCARDLPGGRR